ncbi:MAG: SusD/RagB family nutrient-binding outer membrane lipoprotein, partial [Gemmatimonadaceae bacterium]
MKRQLYAALIVGMIAVPSACNNFLDVNTNPNAPQEVSANLYLPPMLHWFVTSPQFDGRFVGRYNQEWTLPGTSLSTWDRMGYDPSSDNGGQQWRDVYWNLGQNLVDMTTKAEAEQRWDLLGVGQILKAWGWEVTTDLHGEIIVKEAIDQSRFSFDYDTQEYAYGEIQRLLNAAIVNLQKTDGAVSQSYLGKSDKIYNGDRTKWLKFAYGLLALNLNHYSNKATYKPADVIAAVDKSFASNADDALLQYQGTNNDDTNFLGWTRNNLRSYRQTTFVVNLMNGTDFGGVVDPRMSRMLAPS